MAAIGNSPTQQAFTPAIDYFSGNGSTTAFTLSRPVASVAQVQVTIDNVAQNPSSAYTVSANTITFTSAPLSGTNNIYVYYTSPITQVIAPGQGTVTTTSLTSGFTLPVASGGTGGTTSTGSGAVVLATSPTLVTPALGTPSAINLSNATALARAALPSGTVIQVATAKTSANTSWTGTDIYLGLQATLTPTSASSRIFAIATIQCATNGTGRIQFFFRYNTTSGDNSGVSAGDMYVAQPASASTTQLMCASLNTVFTAGTTSPLYVKLCSTKHDGGTGYINSIGTEVCITIMEIAP